MNEKELSFDNFLELLPKKEKIEEFITNISTSEEHSILGISKYILENQNEWQEVINDIQPFLKEYSLAYEDSNDLNIEGENFVIYAIYYQIDSEDRYEYNMSVFGTNCDFINY